MESNKAPICTAPRVGPRLTGETIDIVIAAKDQPRPEMELKGRAEKFERVLTTVQRRTTGVWEGLLIKLATGTEGQAGQ